MRYLFRGSVCLAAMLFAPATGAAAQDYGSAPAGAYNWSGWYLGANAGWGWRSKNPYPPTSYYNDLGVTFGASGLYGGGGGDSASSFGDPDTEGYVAGVTLGYQYQWRWLVLGIDYDLQYARVSNNPTYASASFSKQTGTGPFGPTFTTYTAGNYDPTDGDSNRWYGLARARVGFAHDRWLLFATGGAAYRLSYTSTDPYVVDQAGNVTTYGGYNSSNAWGWVLGGGVEYAFNNLITAKVEYLHMDFGHDTYLDPIATTAVGSPVVYQYERQIDMVRAGVNFRFNVGGGSGY